MSEEEKTTAFKDAESQKGRPEGCEDRYEVVTVQKDNSRGSVAKDIDQDFRLPLSENVAGEHDDQSLAGRDHQANRDGEVATEMTDTENRPESEASAEKNIKATALQSDVSCSPTNFASQIPETAALQTSGPLPYRPLEALSYDGKNGQEASRSRNENAEADDMESMANSHGADKESQPEIQSIMDQFLDKQSDSNDNGRPVPHLKTAGLQNEKDGAFPPRKSSLEAARPQLPPRPKVVDKDLPNPPVPPKQNGVTGVSHTEKYQPPSSPSDSSTKPFPEPEPDPPFDFHRFLEQLRHKSADPVAKFLRSFLNEFGKKEWMVHEQVKIIGDFLTFIANKMALCDVWREVSDAEFDNAKEGMEKLVMNRLYAQTFSPAITPMSMPPSRGRSRRQDQEKLHGPGRRGQHQEDVERDEVLAQKFRIYAWIKEEHLDIPPVGDKGERFLRLAQQELLKIKGYRAPRDKVICVLNCCKVIVGFLKSSKSSDTSADAFIPLLIYVVLHAHPEHLVSNLQYILRFRNQSKLSGEAGYYLSSLSGAIQFIENMDRTTLTITDDEFERNVELAVSAIAEKNKDMERRSPTRMVSEKATISEPEVNSRTSADGSQISPYRRSARGTRSDSTTEGSDDHDAVAGLLRTIQRPLSNIGRMFSEDVQTHATPKRRSVAASVPPHPTPRLSPSVLQPPRSSLDQARLEENGRGSTESRHSPKESMLGSQEAAARQASAETAQAQRIQSAEHGRMVESVSPGSFALELIPFLFSPPLRPHMLTVLNQNVEKHVPKSRSRRD